jgi:hypothetical protein
MPPAPPASTNSYPPIAGTIAYQTTMNLHQYLYEKSADMLAEAENAIRRAHLTHYEKEGPEHIHQRLKALLVLTARGVKERNLGPIIAHADTIARERYGSGYDLTEVQTAFNVLEETIWHGIIRDFPPEEYAEALGLVSTVLGCGKDILARRYVTLASKTKTPSLDMKSLFTGTEG